MGMLSQAYLGEQSVSHLMRTSVSCMMPFFLPERTLGGNALLVRFITPSARFRRCSVGLRGPSFDLRGPET